jgi:hypothetical protein
MSRRTELTFVWLAPVGLVLLMIGFWPLARYIPPPSAADTAVQVAHFYQHDTTAIRAGLLIVFVSFMTYVPLVAVITRLMLCRSRDTMLAWLQLGAGTGSWLFLMIPTMVLSAAAFRPGRSPDVTQALHDIGWFFFFMGFVPFVVQSIAITVFVFEDTADPRGRPVFPRWVAYFGIVFEVLFALGGLCTFFKTGPFAFQGVLTYWIPLAMYGAEILVMSWVCHQAIVSEEDQAIVSPAEPAMSLP